MMDFLRGLAPKPHTDTSCAVAVLPSRFAMERPLSAVPAASASVEAIGTESKSQIVDEHRRQTVAQLGSDAPTGWRTSTTTAVDPQAVQGSATDRIEAGRPIASVPLGRDRGTAIPGARARSAAPADLLPGEGLDAARSPAVPALMGLRDEPRAVPTMAGTPPLVVRSARAHDSDAAAYVPLAARAQAPLSAATVASRIVSRVEERPIVHVTIDRIEVRAPASPQHATPRAKTRANLPRLSLGDYLRGARRPGDAP